MYLTLTCVGLFFYFDWTTNWDQACSFSFDSSTINGMVINTRLNESRTKVTAPVNVKSNIAWSGNQLNGIMAYHVDFFLVADDWYCLFPQYGHLKRNIVLNVCPQVHVLLHAWQTGNSNRLPLEILSFLKKVSVPYIYKVLLSLIIYSIKKIDILLLGCIFSLVFGISPLPL